MNFLENRKRRNFSLLELMLVITILGIITAIALPQFDVSEQEAKEKLSEHNAAAIERTLRQFQNIHGVYPSGYHTGLADDGSVTVSGLSLQVAAAMSADPTAQGAVVKDWANGGYKCTNPVQTTLDAGLAKALKENGIHHLMHNGYGTGKNLTSSFSQSVADGLPVWLLKGNGSGVGVDLKRGASIDNAGTITPGTEVVTINGRALSTWNAYPGEAVALVFMSPEVQWGGNLACYYDKNINGPGTYLGKCKIGMETAPKDPSAGPDSKFPYYIAVFYLSSTQVGSDQGYSAKLLGVLDQNLKPVLD